MGNRTREKLPAPDPSRPSGRVSPLPPPESAEAATRAATSFVTPTLKAIAASAGISGLLAAFGYVVHFSQEDFLGVPLSDGTSGSFVLEGARFVADLCLFSFTSLIPLLAMALLTGLVLLVVAGVRKWEVSRRRRPGVWAVLLLALVFAELACNDLPMVYVSGLLFKNTEELRVGGELNVQPPLPAPLDRVTRLLRDSVICSRVPNLAGCNLGQRQDYRNLLQGWFILNLFATVLLLVVGLRALPRWLQPRALAAGQPPVVAPFWGFLGALLSLALLLDLFGLPFAYARTIKQAVFPTAVIALKDSEVEGGKPGTAEGKRTPQPAATEGRGDSTGASGATAALPLAKNEETGGTTGAVRIQAAAETKVDGAAAKGSPPPSTDQLWQILSYGEKRFVLYNKAKAEIWSIPNEIVRIARIRNEEDILENYLLRKAKPLKAPKREAKQ